MHIIIMILLSPFLLLGKLLGFGRRPEIQYVPEDDPAMAKAIEDARRTLPEFRRLLASPQPGMSDFAIKARFSYKGGSEHCWVDNLVMRGPGFLGRLDNDPENLKGLALGSTVNITEDMITDWAYSKDGFRHGHFTTRVLLPLMSRKIRRQLEKIYGWSNINKA